MRLSLFLLNEHDDDDDDDDVCTAIDRREERKILYKCMVLKKVSGLFIGTAATKSPPSPVILVAFSHITVTNRRCRHILRQSCLHRL